MHHYTESGLRNVWLANGYKTHATAYGKGVSFADIASLHREIARWLVAYRPRLTGAEFRFLRHELELSQAALAKLLGNDAQSVALWEKGKVRLPAWADRFMRALYREHADGNVKIRALIEGVSRLETKAPGARRLEASKARGGWKLRAA